ncbi:dihydroorotase [Bifidobacterium tsurumiense]|uniref:Dihydroorotase PyrC n=1 Tax=Bifidobacterium tsurumiense TaxID=356829 RepID=A0A087EEB6_9BIFI|nr:dihydroorotase [Bifidobacterium tsurumiense]KFJ06117.1 dihydroorotase PyrC [Bifidobacterium tsurumiense]MDY4678087.1 dihydroorotase [Bifidobacterium tsurumiense]MSS12003.1 amidohydrolase family protein [Bifidobacterium tsurumiense]
MLTLHDIRVWDTEERIDVVIPQVDEARLLRENGAQISGDIDASSMTIAPGFADPHVHFRDPGQTYKESMVSGAKAAASGGYTNVLIMPNTLLAIDGEDAVDGEPGAQEVLSSGCRTSLEYLQRYEDIHGVQLPVQYALSVCASKGREGKEASDPARWQHEIPGHDDESKTSWQREHPVVAISDDGSAVTPDTLEETLRNAQATGLCLIEHCEHHDTGAVNDGPIARQLGVPGIPADTELAIVERDIDAARRTGVHIHFQHVSTALAFDAIRSAKAEGLPVTCETAPHYLALCDEDLLRYGTMAKMNPPLRSAADRQATIAAVADGTVDMLATDHAPHTDEEKARGFVDAPNGIIGLECAYGVCHKVLVEGGYIDEQRLIELMSVAPSRLVGHRPTDVAALLNTSSSCATKRVLDLAAVEHPDQVNLVILDTTRRWTVDPERFHSAARNTPFAGWEVTGLPLATIIGSSLVFSRLDAAV